MFETFDVPGFYLANQATLSVIASGKPTGLVVDCGHSFTSAIPVF
jgi:actin-related protein